MIAVVVPTIREEQLKNKFLVAWKELFEKHDVILLVVHDGDLPYLTVSHGKEEKDISFDKFLPKRVKRLIFNRNDGVRNAGFYYVAQFLPEVDIIISLDDDVLPVGDTIADHLAVLSKRVPISWISTTTDEFPRGFPYGVREEAEVVFSHGVWNGVKDYDAPTQLAKGNPETGFFVGAIPKHVFFPLCGMNIAFKRKVLPYVYFAPMGKKVGVDRFADIWMGVELKKYLDSEGLAIFSGGATVLHERASNVWTNLAKEVTGLLYNETFWQGKADGDYFFLYKDCREKWRRILSQLI